MEKLGGGNMYIFKGSGRLINRVSEISNVKTAVQKLYPIILNRYKKE